MLDLGPTARTVFCGLFFAAQLALIATAGRRTDHAYGFRMFDDSTSVSVHVLRGLESSGLLPIEGGAWDAADCRGQPHHLVWSKLVRIPAPEYLDVTLMAPYGPDAALEQAQGALRYVADHTPDDCQTVMLRAEVTLRRNGHPPTTVQLDAPRSLPPPR